MIENPPRVRSVFHHVGFARSTVPSAPTRLTSCPSYQYALSQTPGRSQPPKKSVAMSAEAVTMWPNSEIMNALNFMAEYSV